MPSSPAVQELTSCTIRDVDVSWSEVARTWSRFVRDGHDIHRERVHGPALLTACGDVRGLRALDLGCGEGWCSRELAGRGAGVSAVDVSAAMIAEAHSHPAQDERPVEYITMDAVDVDGHEWGGRFDLVTACMALHCMPDPAAALRAVRKVLAPEGQLVCSIPNPMVHANGGRRDEVGDYFKSAAQKVWWDTGFGEPWPTIRYSRPWSEYVRMLKDAGLVIWDLLEPFPSDADVARHERLRKASRLPYYLVFVAAAR